MRWQINGEPSLCEFYGFKHAYTEEDEHSVFRPVDETFQGGLKGRKIQLQAEPVF